VPKRARAFVLSTLLLLPIGISACAGNGSDEVLARVGGSAITRPSFEHWMSVAKAMTPTEARALLRDPSREMTLKQRILSFLISSARTIGEAREDGIEVSDSQANEVLDRLRFEQSHGLTTPQSESQSFVFDKAETTIDRVWIIKVHMLAERVEQRQRSEAERQITQTQIAGYYTKHKRYFVVPERRDVAVIQAFRKATADTAKREIESGRNLLSVIKLRDEEPTIGGFKRDLSRQGVPHPYEHNFFTARPHVLVGPLRAEIYYLFEVTAVIPPRQRPLAEVQAVIRRMLVSGAQRRVFTSVVRALDQRWRAKTRCRAAYTVLQCGDVLS
jgi:foldase protein PrsA